MKLIISHMSALRYLRASAPDPPRGHDTDKRVYSIADALSSAVEIKHIKPANLGFIMSEEYPLDILVPSTERRRDTYQQTSHVWSRPIPYGALYPVDDDVYVCSPAFVFVQLAAVLDEIELARLALELCGIYSLTRTSFRSRYAPLTNVKSLERFVKRAGRFDGARRARSVLRWVNNNSRSPMETNMVLALCLPRRFGGFGLPVPEINPTIEVKRRMKSLVDGEHYSPDCLWKRESNGRTINITAEYDSHEHHDSANDAEATRIRRNSFKTLGYLVTSINKSQMSSAEEFQYPARQIARDLKLWRSALDEVQLEKCNELLKTLAREDAR